VDRAVKTILVIGRAEKFIEAIQHAVLKNLRNNRADRDAAKIISGQRFDMCIMGFYQRYRVAVTKITRDKTGP